MGWTFTVRDSLSPKQFMDRQFTWENDKSSNKPIDSAVVGWGEYYAAIERTDKATGEKVVWAAVAMLRNVPNARDGYTFGYKDMDESMGPVQQRCPLRILDKLTPTEWPHANEWRAKCRAYHAKPKPKKGQKVVFDKPISFGSYGEHAELTYYSGSVFEANGQRYRITGWKDKSFSVGA